MVGVVADKGDHESTEFQHWKLDCRPVSGTAYLVFQIDGSPNKASWLCISTTWKKSFQALDPLKIGEQDHAGWTEQVLVGSMGYSTSYVKVEQH